MRDPQSRAGENILHSGARLPHSLAAGSGTPKSPWRTIDFWKRGGGGRQRPPDGKCRRVTRRQSSRSQYNPVIPDSLHTADQGSAPRKELSGAMKRFARAFHYSMWTPVASCAPFSQQWFLPTPLACLGNTQLAGCSQAFPAVPPRRSATINQIDRNRSRRTGPYCRS